MMYPVLDKTFSGSSESTSFQLPLKSASTKHSIPLDKSDLTSKPTKPIQDESERAFGYVTEKAPPSELPPVSPFIPLAPGGQIDANEQIRSLLPEIKLDRVIFRGTSFS